MQDPTLRLALPGGSTFVNPTANGLPGSNEVLTYTATATGTYYIDAGGTEAGKTAFPSPPARVLPSIRRWVGASSTRTSSGSSHQHHLRPPATPISITARPHSATRQRRSMTTVTQILRHECPRSSSLAFTQVNPGGYYQTTRPSSAPTTTNDGAGAFAYYPGSTASIRRPRATSGSTPARLEDIAAVRQLQLLTPSLTRPATRSASRIPASTTPRPASITYADNAQFVQDTQQYSVMSYFDEFHTGSAYRRLPDTPMMYDIYAAAAASTAPTCDPHRRHGLRLRQQRRFGIRLFHQHPHPGFCIWDAGGTDTLNCSGLPRRK